METRKLTSHLLNLDPPSFQKSTTHPFLSHAGAGTILPPTLSKWLAQDRLYAIAYIRFASQLIARCSLLLPSPSSSGGKGSLEERVLDMLIDALANVQREVKFFEDTAQKYSLDLSSRDISEGLTGYRSLFENLGSEKVGDGLDGGIWSSNGEVKREGVVGLLPALVLLWGTEICYLTAWRYAASHIPLGNAGDKEMSKATQALYEEFIPNWSSKEFEGFVERIGGLTDGVWDTVGGDFKEKLLGELEDIWRRVMKVEVVFWPDV